MFGVKELREELDRDRLAWQSCVRQDNTLINLLSKRLDATERGLGLKASALATEHSMKALEIRIEKLFDWAVRAGERLDALEHPNDNIFSDATPPKKKPTKKRKPRK